VGHVRRHRPQTSLIPASHTISPSCESRTPDRYRRAGAHRKQALIREFTERIRRVGHFPHMVAMIAEGIHPDAAETRDERFEFGLDCLLDGIAARLATRRLQA